MYIINDRFIPLSLDVNNQCSMTHVAADRKNFIKIPYYQGRHQEGAKGVIPLRK